MNLCEHCKKQMVCAGGYREHDIGGLDLVVDHCDEYVPACEEHRPVKAYDQSVKADGGKPRLHLVPTSVVECIARVREYGVKKYGDSDNWKRVEMERYVDAAYRHLIAYIKNPGGIDAESGLPHLWHLACNVAFLCEMTEENENDQD